MNIDSQNTLSNILREAQKTSALLKKIEFHLKAIAFCIILLTGGAFGAALKTGLISF